MLNNIVGKTEQCRQHNIDQCMLFSTGLNKLCDFGCVYKPVFTKIISLQTRDPSTLIKTKSYWSANETNYNKTGGGAGN